MITDIVVAGIDVGKQRLDVQVGVADDGFSVDNSPAGYRQLLTRLRQAGVGRVGLEASGGYERAVAAALAGADFAVVLCDPGLVRAFARAMRVKAKTDRIDAKMIARYVAAGEALPLWHPDPIRDRLGELGGLRRQLLAEQTVWAQRLEQVGAPASRRLIGRKLLRLKAELALVAAEIARHIATHPELQQRDRAYRAIPGVGPVLATALSAELPELGHLSARRIASLCGVAPHPRQSGQTDRGGKCTGGRPQVRNVLYMATLSAIKAKHSRLFPFYERLRRNGKPFKLAITATMRKFLTILNAIARDNAQYRPS